MNINFIKDRGRSENKKEARKNNRMFKTNKKKVMKKQGIYVIDRGSDIKEIYKWFEKNKEEYVIRAKKSRILIDEKGRKKKITKFKNGIHKIELNSGKGLMLHVIERKGYMTKLYLFTNSEENSEKITEYYFKRGSIEKDFNKMKQLGLEEIRLFSMIKIKNILAIILFIIILGQDTYEKVVEKTTMMYEHIGLYYKKYCKWKSLGANLVSFLKLVLNLGECMSYKLFMLASKHIFLSVKKS